MVPSIRSAIVRIRREENGSKITIGAGFLIDENHILTCAHVVSKALGIKDKSKPEGEINLDFPYVKGKSDSKAHIISWLPPKIHPSGGETDDIAILQLSTPKPEGAKPVNSILVHGEYKDDDFRAYGYPSFSPGGAWVYGTVRDSLPSGRIQIENLNVSEIAVQAGFSGTPVWDDDKNGIIGMVVEAVQYTKVGFIIPLKSIFQSCPEAEGFFSSVNSYSSEDPWLSLMRNIDFYIRDDQYKSVRPLLSKLQHLANSQNIELDIAGDIFTIIRKMQLEVHRGGSFRSIFEGIEKGIISQRWQIRTRGDRDKYRDLLKIVNFIFDEARDQLQLDPGIPIPIVLLVMNGNEAQELASGAAFERYPKQLYEDFISFKEQLGKKGINNWINQYKEAPYLWQPFEDISKNIKDIISDAIVEPCIEHKPIKPIFIDIRDINKNEYRHTLKHLRAIGCIVIMDPISMRHPTIQQEFRLSALEAFPNTFVVNVTPITDISNVFHEIVVILDKAVNLEFHKRCLLDKDYTCYEVENENQLCTWIRSNTPKMISLMESKLGVGIQKYLFQYSGGGLP